MWSYQLDGWTDEQTVVYSGLKWLTFNYYLHFPALDTTDGKVSKELYFETKDTVKFNQTLWNQ